MTPPPLTCPRNHSAVSAQTLLARRPDSTAGESRDAADLTSAGHALPEHAEEPEEDERTQSRRTVGELVQFVRGSACPGFTPESICPSLEPTNLNPLSNSDLVAQTSHCQRIAELAATRRPEPIDVPSAPPDSLPPVPSPPHLRSALRIDLLAQGLCPCL